VSCTVVGVTKDIFKKGMGFEYDYRGTYMENYIGEFDLFDVLDSKYVQVRVSTGTDGVTLDYVRSVVHGPDCQQFTTTISYNPDIHPTLIQVSEMVSPIIRNYGDVLVAQSPMQHEGDHTYSIYDQELHESFEPFSVPLAVGSHITLVEHTRGLEAKVLVEGRQSLHLDYLLDGLQNAYDQRMATCKTFADAAAYVLTVRDALPLQQ